MMNRAGTEKITKIYSVLETTINELRGIRYLVPEIDEGAGAEADPASQEEPVAEGENPEAPKTPAEPEEPKADTKADEARPENEPNFDQTKAKTLIGNLRDDKAKAIAAKDYWKGEHDSLSADYQTLKKQLAEREEADKTAANATKKLAILDEHGLPESFLDFLIGDDEKAWGDKAALLADGRGGAPRGSNVPTGGRKGPVDKEDRIVEMHSKQNDRGW